MGPIFCWQQYLFHCIHCVSLPVIIAFIIGTIIIILNLTLIIIIIITIIIIIIVVMGKTYLKVIDEDTNVYLVKHQ